MAVRLSGRLAALAGMVTEGNRLADIGTDHGYIPVCLCQQKKIPGAIAMDLRPGPLAHARAHVRQQGLQAQIELRLSDGLENLRAGEADTVLIAGMGGGLVQRILAGAGDALDGVTELILQPQSELARVRAFLRESGWYPDREDMVEEDGKFYPMMRMRRGQIPDRICRAQEEYGVELCDLCGPILLQTGHPVLLAWIRREQRICGEILKRLCGQPREAARQRQEEISRRQEYLARAANIITGIKQETEG